MATLTVFSKFCNLTSNLNTVIRNNKFLNSLTLYTCNIFIKHTYSPKLLNPKLSIKNERNLTKFALPEPSGDYYEKLASLHLMKREVSKKGRVETVRNRSNRGVYDIFAFSTAGEYNLEELLNGLKQENLYTTKNIENNPNVIHAIAKDEDVANEPSEIFFFREGTVVMWNVAKLESNCVLDFLKGYERNNYSEALETESMTYKKMEQGKTYTSSNGNIVINTDDNVLEKYIFSNAMALSVKVGMWESSLAKYTEEFDYITNDLRKKRKITLTQEDMLRKYGELFALRDEINWNSALLDTPDLYLNKDQLEVIYSQICSYFKIPKRAEVINRKINNCLELIELLSPHLTNKLPVRLGLMIIILIMTGIGFEIGYLEKYMH